MSETLTDTGFASFTEAYLEQTDQERHLADHYVAAAEAEEPIQRFYTEMITNGDTFTLEHSQRDARAAVTIGLRLGFPTHDLSLLAESAVSHDIGKEDAGVLPLIQSTERFADGSAERTMIEHHVSLGAERIEASEWQADQRRKIASIVGAHHYFSGKQSYGTAPDADVAHIAEALAAADMLDALASERPYKDAYSREECEAIMRTQYTGNPNNITALFHPEQLQASQLGHLALRAESFD